jgi:tetratricopeptide (TPR) repeat protein
MVSAAPDQGKIHAMIYYYLGYFAEKTDRKQEASKYYQLARKMPADYVFPFQYEAIDVLRHAARTDAQDARAPYYLGNLLYDWQPEEAVKLWEVSARLDPSFAIVHRNLALAYMHQKTGSDLNRAIAELEKAVASDRKYALHFAELDELYEQARVPLEKRLALLQQNQGIVSLRDDALNRELALMVGVGKYEEAIGILIDRWFAVAEGANLNVVDQWANAHLLRGQSSIGAGRYAEALADLRAAVEIPSNIPTENVSGGGRRAEIAYWTGMAHDGLGDHEKATQIWNKAALTADAESSRRSAVATTFSGEGVQSYYRGLCLQRLGEDAKARTIFEGLVKTGRQALEESPGVTGSPTGSGRRPQSPRIRSAIAHYLVGLGYVGLGEKGKAKDELSRALELSPDLLGARVALAAIR